MSNADPLDFTGVSLTDRISAKARVEILLPAEIVKDLIILRTQRNIRPENTAAWLGRLISDEVARLKSNAPISTTRETPALKVIRQGIGSLMLETGKTHFDVSTIMRQTALSQPTVRLAFIRLAQDGLVSLGGIGHSPSGRLVNTYALTPEGIAKTAADHPDEEVRFTLGGFLPADLDPVLNAPALVEPVAIPTMRTIAEVARAVLDSTPESD